MKKKVFGTIVCSVLIVTISVLGTLAYLTDTDKVVNTFTVGNVDIKVDEADVDENGVPIEGADRVTENAYHLMPGQTYTKDPTLTIVDGSEESYVRMLVTITKYDVLQEICDNEFLPQDFVEGWDECKWISTQVVDIAEDGKSATYEFRYYETVSALNKEDVVLEALFETFTVPETFDGDDLKGIAGIQIIVEGHAIQKAGFENEDAAWAAFETQMEKNE